MKNDFCDLDETILREMEIPPLAIGLLTSPFQHNVEGGWVSIPLDTFKQFTDCVTAYVVAANPGQNAEVSDGGPLTHESPAAQSRRSLH